MVEDLQPTELLSSLTQSVQHQQDEIVAHKASFEQKDTAQEDTAHDQEVADLKKEIVDLKKPHGPEATDPKSRPSYAPEPSPFA